MRGTGSRSPDRCPRGRPSGRSPPHPGGTDRYRRRSSREPLLQAPVRQMDGIDSPHGIDLRAGDLVEMRAETLAPPRIEARRYGLARQPVGLGREQELDARHRHLHGHAPSRHGCLGALEMLAPRLVRSGAQRRLMDLGGDHAGRDRIDRYAPALELFGQAFRQAHEGGLGGSIRAVARKRAECAAPREGDDARAIASLEKREGVLDQEIGAEDIVPQGGPPGVAVRLLHGSDGPEGAGAEDDGVESRHLGSHPPYERAHLALIADIAGAGARHCVALRDAAERVDAARAGEDRVPTRGKRPHQSRADSGAGPRDEDPAARRGVHGGAHGDSPMVTRVRPTRRQRAPSSTPAASTTTGDRSLSLRADGSTVANSSQSVRMTRASAPSVAWRALDAIRTSAVGGSVTCGSYAVTTARPARSRRSLRLIAFLVDRLFFLYASPHRATRGRAPSRRTWRSTARLSHA